jgi:transcriptional regulator with XRE-family HTH domain
MRVAVVFADNLKRLRGAADLSQEETGVRAGLHRTEISQLERGLRVARIDTLVKLAGGLGVEPGELLKGLDWTPGETRPGSFQIEPAEPRERDA